MTITRACIDASKWTEVQQAFQELRALSQQYGFHVLLVVFPLLENGEHASFDGYRWSAIHERIVEEAARWFLCARLATSFFQTKTNRPEGLTNPIDSTPKVLGMKSPPPNYRTLINLGVTSSYRGYEGVELMEK